MQELINNNEDYTVVLIPYIADIMSNPSLSDKVRNLRWDAILQLKARLARYKERGYMEILLCAIARKKAAMIMQANTKTEMGKVIELPKPHYDGCKFVSTRYDVPEEEMIAWSETSFRGPLNAIGFKRYKELFEQIFPEMAKQIFRR